MILDYNIYLDETSMMPKHALYAIDKLSGPALRIAGPNLTNACGAHLIFFFTITTINKIIETHLLYKKT